MPQSDLQKKKQLKKFLRRKLMSSKGMLVQKQSGIMLSTLSIPIIQVGTGNMRGMKTALQRSHYTSVNPSYLCSHIKKLVSGESIAGGSSTESTDSESDSDGDS